LPLYSAVDTDELLLDYPARSDAAAGIFVGSNRVAAILKTAMGAQIYMVARSRPQLPKNE